MSLSDLPLVNACLNGLSTVLLAFGYLMIRRGREVAHRNCMMGVFLISYLTYHFQVPRTVFSDPEWFRPIYLVILGTHTVLAMVLLPLVIRTLWLALRGEMKRHRSWARWTWPIWIYVSVTGVGIYLLLYQVYPQPRVAPEPVMAVDSD